jgi:hypothetical protein
LLTEEEKFDLEYGEFPDRTVDDSLVCEYSDNEEEDGEEAPPPDGPLRETAATEERQALLGVRRLGGYDSVPSNKAVPRDIERSD